MTIKFKSMSGDRVEIDLANLDLAKITDEVTQDGCFSYEGIELDDSKPKTVDDLKSLLALVWLCEADESNTNYEAAQILPLISDTTLTRTLAEIVLSNDDQGLVVHGIDIYVTLPDLDEGTNLAINIRRWN